MADETDTLDRIERARSEPMTASVVDSDPLVVQVDNESNDTVHTVVPESLHCSCEDHTYRGAVCKHLAIIALGEDESVEPELRDIVRNSITDELMGLEGELLRLRNQIEEIESEQEQYRTLRGEMESALDQDQQASEEDASISDDGAVEEVVEMVTDLRQSRD